MFETSKIHEAREWNSYYALRSAEGLYLNMDTNEYDTEDVKDATWFETEEEASFLINDVTSEFVVLVEVSTTVLLHPKA